jgi:hypothetical protein
MTAAALACASATGTAAAAAGGTGAPDGTQAPATPAQPSAATGGSAPTGTPPAGSGATGGNSTSRPFRIPPVIKSFSASPRSVVFGGPATRLRFRVDAVNVRSVRMRLVARLGARVLRVGLGSRRTGRVHTVRWARAGVTPGTWALTLVPVDARGTQVARAARAKITVRVKPKPKPAPAPAPAPGTDGVFPIRGSYSWGDGFGVDRGDHRHGGQDLAASAGTPLVSPRNGTVYAAGYGSGPGEYVVIKDASLDRSYVFFHLTRGSTSVSEGQSVRAGQQVGRVGSTGHSTGPHLHFELWVGGWWSGGHAIDPAPTLRSWAR